MDHLAKLFTVLTGAVRAANCLPAGVLYGNIL